ncbi:MAG: hypothetical protein WBB74_01145, partial [Gaiellaceae bacterium]
FLAMGASVFAVAGSSGTTSQWRPLLKVPGIVDVAGPRADGRLVLSTHGGLFLLRSGNSLQPFARGPQGYLGSVGEPYLTLSPGRRLPSAKCSFRRDDVFILEPGSKPGVIRVDRSGRSRRFTDFPSGSFPAGIAFDGVGRFGFRLLVTSSAGGKTTLYAIDCRGRPRVVTHDAPVVEGGIAVAPRSFGRFAGELIAADEHSGRIFAFGSRGVVRLVAESGLPAGGDIGVEALGFVPRGGGAGYLADLGAPGSPTVGTDSLLVLQGRDLARARLRAGDLVGATEAGARTIALRCARRCTIRRVGVGPVATHGEGHITFALSR